MGDMVTELCNLLSMLTGVVLGAFLSWFLNVVITSLIYKPKISIGFGTRKPCFMYRRYFRLKVMNKGRTIARSCIAKFSCTEANADKWREKELLHWTIFDPRIYRAKSGNVEIIYRPLNIAKDDYELLDLFYLETPGHPFTASVAWGSSQLPRLVVYSYPAFEGSSIHPRITSVPLSEPKPDRRKIVEGTLYKGKITVYCDNGDPETLTFYFKFEGGVLFIGKDSEKLEPVIPECLS